MKHSGQRVTVITHRIPGTRLSANPTKDLFREEVSEEPRPSPRLFPKLRAQLPLMTGSSSGEEKEPQFIKRASGLTPGCMDCSGISKKFVMAEPMGIKS